jgi:hypothetical protein
MYFLVDLVEVALAFEEEGVTQLENTIFLRESLD